MIKCKSCPLSNMLPENGMRRNILSVHLNVLSAETQPKNAHGPEKNLITIIKCLT